MILKKKKLSIVLISVLLQINLLTPQVPKLLNYQGKLIDSEGQLLDGTYFITFCIYNKASGGTALWCETQQLKVQNGIYNVLLGGVNSINLDFSEPYWLGIKVGSDVEMIPRQRIVSVGYAFRARDANKLEGKTSSAFSDSGHTHEELEESQEIDDKISDHASITDVHHTPYTDTDAQAVVDAHAGIADAHHKKYSDTDAVNAIKSNDGAGSGIDADLLDGNNSSDFAKMSSANSPNGVTILDESGYLPDNSVDTGALKTSTCLIAHTSPQGWNTYTVTGGSYCFYPQLKMWGTQNERWGCNIYEDNNAKVGFSDFTTAISLSTGSVGVRIDAKFRYITSSGQDFWIFLLVNLITKKILAVSAAPDHPSYGNGAKIDKVPHPFADYYEQPLPDNYEIVLIEKECSRKLRVNARGKIADLIFTDYCVDFQKEYAYEPLHSGQFYGRKPVMIKSIPDYIKVRRLKKLTSQKINTSSNLNSE